MIDLNHILQERTDFQGKTLSERMSYYKCPSLSLAVIADGQISTYCCGYKNRETKQKTDTETMYQAGSISKPVFAAAVMKLAGKRQLSLDLDIREYGNYNFYEAFDQKEHKVTLRQLLSHTAGFNLHGFTGYLVSQEIPDLMQILQGKDPADNIPLYLLCEPGTRWSYSGGGYILAQKVVADVLQKPIDVVIKDEILQPFGLDHSGYKNPTV